MLPAIEIFRTDQFYIFVYGTHSLWWNRISGEFEAKTSWDLASSIDPECLGLCYGIVGKVLVEGIVEPRLMLVKEAVQIGEYQAKDVIYKIKSVVLLHQQQIESLNLTPCKKHQNNNRNSKKIGLFDQKAALAKTWGVMKSATNTIKSTTQQAAAFTIPQVKTKFASKDKDKFERRILEELLRIFTDTDSFYLSLTFDLTNSIQRQSEDNEKIPLWRRVDDRFFWNKYMLQDIIDINTRLSDPWIVPVIQGFVQIETCKLGVGFDPIGFEALEPRYESFRMMLISRRSRHRAGTRYKRRGVDEDGNCANYVETEQIVCFDRHVVSFVQTRGSVPVFWSQPGYKYRPPPRIDKGEAETQIVFEKHFQQETKVYGPVCVVNLIEQTGKEKIIFDAYTNHLLLYDNPDVTYTTFDFHEYCRGMHFENVSHLIVNLTDVIKEMCYCWRDERGVICKQNGVFRVNCIDCLDRTNVVQTALAKSVLEVQLTKLGLLPPEGQMPTSLRSTFQLLWANNGDIISKQYAGTNALKGDYTRTGERKFTGLMKDGMNSANRYYLSRFKDAYRQTTIDLMLGNELSEDVFNTDNKQDEEDTAATAEHVKLLIEDCKKLLIPEDADVLGSWGLVDADPVTGDPTETEMDTVLILTKDSYYIAEYDEQIDRFTKYQRIELKDLNLIELGSSHVSVFKLKNQSYYCVRLNYFVNGEEGYFHMFRSTNLRFFNNMAVVIKTNEEIVESLKAICESFLVAIEIAKLPSVMYVQGKQLEKKKSKVIMSGGSCRLGSYLDIGLSQGITRNVSETQLVALRSAGTKALTNISQQFSKINKLGQSLRRPRAGRRTTGVGNAKKETPSFTIGAAEEEKQSPNDDKRRESTSSEEDSAEIDTSKNTVMYSPRTKIKDMHLPNIGILMQSDGKTRKMANNLHMEPVIDNVSLSQVVECKQVSIKGKHPLLHTKSDATFDINKLNLSLKNYKESLEVIKDVKDSPDQKLQPPTTLCLTKNISKSTTEFEENQNDQLNIKRANSEVELNKSGITSSRSENTLKSVKLNIASVITSPSAATREMVLSPFSKLTKGMQNLGANLDPRKLKNNSQYQAELYRMSDVHVENVRILNDKWKTCRSKLIAL